MKKNSELEIQNILIQKVQESIPPHCSLVEELSEILDISIDSVYRRLRNETILSIEETAIICKHYKISFDSLTGNNTNTVSFNYGLMRNEAEFIKHLEFMLGEVEFFKRTPNCVITYAAIDIPIFHHFQFPELTAFKMFYWLKSVINEQRFSNQKFNSNLISNEMMEICTKMFHAYKVVKSVEIWTDATINSLIKQIDFFWESGMFESKEDALLICNQAEQEIITIQRQAESGSKDFENDNFKLYFSEIEIGNNCILTTSDTFKRAYLSYNTLNLLVTTHAIYNNETEAWLQNLIKKSTLISGASEKIRYQFFKRALDGIHAIQKKIQE